MTINNRFLPPIEFFAPWLKCLVLPCILAGCSVTATYRGADKPTGLPDGVETLNGTQWSLVQIRSMDDTQYRPGGSARYLLRFQPQGRFSSRIDCNQVSGQWTHTGKSLLEFGPLVATRVLCPQGSLFGRMMNDLEATRSFVLENGRLFLATKADGAILEFAPDSGDGTPPVPAFDCTEADASVETMICGDEALIGLDLYLDELFQAALYSGPAEQIDAYRAMQRGWISGRNDCWKAEDVRQCVVDEYLRRISELEVKTGYLVVRNPVRFICPNDSILTVFFYNDSVLPLAVINRDDRQDFVWRTAAASGSRYLGLNLEFWQQGGEAIIEDIGSRQVCFLR